MSQPPWPLLSQSSSRSTTARAPRDSRKRSRSRDGRTAPGDAAAPEAYPIIALCHLGWDWVWQRPQQFLSRLARRHPVLFVETYCSDTRSTYIELKTPENCPTVTVLQMHLPASRWSDARFIDAERRRTLQAALTEELAGRFEHPLLWFYDPMAVMPFAGQLGERAIVYDCMDELSQFKGAPPELIARERILLKKADVVFCGGQKMRQKRLPLNPNTHFFGTGVDIAHFGQALSAELPVAPEIAKLGDGPVLGYFGVIDERIDYPLLAKLADARADWNIVMVGPTAKVDPADFPRRPNLHFIGGRPYAALPTLTKGFSVAMMPFALNAATEYINPTKALEYMAAGRPVVSTALDEVRLNFGEVARIATSHDEFIALCEREAAKPSRTRIARGLKLASKNTWEAITAQMEQHIADALKPAAQKSAARAVAENPSPFAGLAYV